LPLGWASTKQLTGHERPVGDYCDAHVGREWQQAVVRRVFAERVVDLDELRLVFTHGRFEFVKCTLAVVGYAAETNIPGLLPFANALHVNV
jgi:hypothetical protein